MQAFTPNIQPVGRGKLGFEREARKKLKVYKEPTDELGKVGSAANQLC